MVKSVNENSNSTRLFAPFLAWFRGIFRFGLDIVKNFNRDNCYEKASALAFYTALSIVPVLAVVLGIARGFGFGQNLETDLSTQLFQQPEVKDKLIQFAHSWLHNVEGGVIAGVGTLVLLWSVISLLVSIENSLNEIWKIKKGRSFIHKIRDYVMVIIIAPMIFVASSSINLYLVSEITKNAESYPFLSSVSSYVMFFLSLFPLFLMWLLFTFLYVFIPNTKVYFREGIIAGFLAGTAFQIWQWLYIKFQVNVTSYSTVYGSFAAVPLFLIWLQISWIIVLVGAEIAVEIENGFFMGNRKPQLLPLKTAAQWMVYQCIDTFVKGAPPLNDFALKRKLGIPLDCVHQMLEMLTQHRILAPVTVEGETVGYQPAQPIHNITPQLICNTLDKMNEVPLYLSKTPELEMIEALPSNSQKPLYAQIA